MKDYKPLGDYIREVNVRNKDLNITEPKGININKYFMPSVANIIGTDLSNYKLVSKNQFACNLMHVGRDEKIPMAMHTDDSFIIVSPAYFVFEIAKTDSLLPEYLMMWFRRSEFDRNAWFYTDADVRGGLPKEALLNMLLPVPPIEKQREIVAEYETLSNRISINQQIIQNLEATAQTLYRKMFVDGIDKENLPEGWRLGTLGEVAEIITRGKSPKYLEDSNDLVIGQRCVRNHMVDLNIARTHLPKQGSTLLKYGDILINSTGEGSLGRVGQVYFNKGNVTFDSHITLVRFIDEADSFYYGVLLTLSENDIETLAIGSTGQTELPRESICNFEVLVPCKFIVDDFYNKVKNVKNIASIKKQENEKLTELQSLLLAKMGR